MGGDAERERDGGTSEGDGGIIRSAGFGNVLYVDPREVYLDKHRIYRVSAQEGGGELTPHHKARNSEFATFSKNSRCLHSPN